MNKLQAMMEQAFAEGVQHGATCVACQDDNRVQRLAERMLTDGREFVERNERARFEADLAEAVQLHKELLADARANQFGAELDSSDILVLHVALGSPLPRGRNG